jgi:hypothetical protein
MLGVCSVYMHVLVLLMMRVVRAGRGWASDLTLRVLPLAWCLACTA